MLHYGAVDFVTSLYNKVKLKGEMGFSVSKKVCTLDMKILSSCPAILVLQYIVVFKIYVYY